VLCFSNFTEVNIGKKKPNPVSSVQMQWRRWKWPGVARQLGRLTTGPKGETTHPGTRAHQNQGRGYPEGFPPAGFSKILYRRRLRMPRDPVTRRGAARGRVTCRTVRCSHYRAFPDAGADRGRVAQARRAPEHKIFDFPYKRGAPEMGARKGGSPLLRLSGFPRDRAHCKVGQILVGKVR